MAQPASEQPQPVLKIPRLVEPPVLEDFLDMVPSPETAASMARVDRFVQRWPADGEPARIRTTAYLGYTTDALHVVYLAFDPEPARLRAHLIRREEVFSVNDDAVELRLDTYGDRRQSYISSRTRWACNSTHRGRSSKGGTTSRSISSGTATDSAHPRGSSC